MEWLNNAFGPLPSSSKSCGKQSRCTFEGRSMRHSYRGRDISSSHNSVPVFTHLQFTHTYTIHHVVGLSYTCRPLDRGHARTHACTHGRTHVCTHTNINQPDEHPNENGPGMRAADRLETALGHLERVS